MQAAEREAELRSLHCQAATLADDAETAQLRAEKAERRMHELHEETQRLRESASQACAKEQVTCTPDYRYLPRVLHVRTNQISCR